MSDVFVSYKRKDELRVGRLVRALEAQGLTIWWDRGLPGGELWRSNIEIALAQAQCALVIWTRASTGAEGGFVKDEASRAARRQILVPVMLDKVDPPLGFGELQAVDLTHWRGSARDPFLQDLVSAIRAKIEGRAVPPPQGPIKRLRRRLTAGGVVSALVLIGSAFASNALNLQNTTCGLAWTQPWLSDACGALGLGARPPREERIAWEQRPKGDCAWLRHYLGRNPPGAYRATAADLLNARGVTMVPQWTRTRRPLQILIGRDVPPSLTEAAAKNAAIARGRTKATLRCQELADAGGSRLGGADIEAREWTCDVVQGGRVCGFEGSALCTLDERSPVEQETCR